MPGERGVRPLTPSHPLRTQFVIFFGTTRIQVLFPGTVFEKISSPPGQEDKPVILIEFAGQECRSQD